MAASLVRVGQAVQPVINLMRDRVLDATLIFGDETEIQMVKEAGRTAQFKSYMWAQRTDGSGASGTGLPIPGYLRSLLVAIPRAKIVDDYEALLAWPLAHARPWRSGWAAASMSGSLFSRSSAARIGCAVFCHLAWVS